ncbi:MAG TPA: ATP-binding protein [Candidatus Binatia bacterium]
MPPALTSASGAPHVPPATLDDPLVDGATTGHVALTSFFEHAPIPIAALDARGTLIAVNEAWRELVRSGCLTGRGFEIGECWLDACDAACPRAEVEGRALRDGLAELLRGTRDALETVYAIGAGGRTRRYRLIARRVAELDGVLLMHVEQPAQLQLDDASLSEQDAIGRCAREHTADASRGSGLLQHEADRRERAGRERQQLLETVSLERKLLTAVLEQMPLGVMIAQAPSGRVVLHNQQLTRLFGAPPAPPGAALGAGGPRALHPDGRPYAAEEYPLVRALRGDTVDAEEIEYERSDGRRVIVRVSAASVRDEAGRLLAAVVAYYDVTDLRRAERRLRASETRYRLASRAINDAIWDWDVIPDRLEWSDGVHLRFGHPREAVGSDISWWLEQIHPQDRARVQHSIEEAFGGTTDSWYDEYRFRRYDGRYVHVVDRGFIVRDDAGRVVRAIGAMQDVTELRRVEAERAALLERERRARAEAEAANRAKDEFLAVVSHELRTPLSPILGFADILREEELSPDDTRAALSTIERNARNLSLLIDDLLDVARITSGKLALVEYAPVHVREIVAAVVDSVRPVAQAKGVQIDAALGSDHDLVAGDPGRLTQIVANLLSNAVKFSSEGGRVRVSVARLHDRCVLTVSDTGKGIAPDLLPHVFERFRQGDMSDTRVHGGLGLGLAIVRHLVELHAGTVAAQSEGEGKGATFTVSLPLMPVRSSR